MFRFLNAFFRFINAHLKLFFFIVYGIVMAYILFDSLALCTSGDAGVFIGIMTLVIMCGLMSLYLIGVLRNNKRAIGIAGIVVCSYFVFINLFRASQMIPYFPAGNGVIFAYFSFEFIQIVIFLAALVFFIIGFIVNNRLCKNMARLLFFIGVCLGVIVYPMSIAAGTQFGSIMTGSIWHLYITPFLFMGAVFIVPVTLDFLGYYEDLYKTRKIKKVIYEDEEEDKPSEKVVEAKVEEEPKEEPKEEPSEEPSLSPSEEPEEEVKEEPKEPVEE